MRNVKTGLALTAIAAGIALTGSGTAVADATSTGSAVGSPGFLSGNMIQIPIHIPVNLCGNTVNVIALLNPAFGNHCANNG
jgi:hypothetical protein